MSRARVIALASVAILLAAIAALTAKHAKLTIALPYSDAFTHNQADEWKVYGGSWRLIDGSLVNRSDERGAKVVMGEATWSDYSITADMMMLGHGGDVGVVARVSYPENGINAYQGYYVGIRAQDQALVIGIADHDWIEARPVSVHGGIRHLVWYRMQVVVVGCDIVARLENLQTSELTWARMHAAPCFRTGKVGLRSLNTGAAYRNIKISGESRAEFEEGAAHLPAPAAERYPVRESDYSQMRLGYFQKPGLLLDSLLGPAGNALRDESIDQPVLESIHSLEMTHKAETVRIRGVVSITDPLYVQDASGGIHVLLSTPNILNAGDEVELLGKVKGTREASFEVKSYRVLWESNLVTPVSISSTQAARGEFDGSLVELSGVLRSRKELNDGTLELGLDDIAQRFLVNVPRGLSDEGPTWWQMGSTVRVRGVCISGSLASTDSAFLLLLRNANDVEYLSSPPWTQGLRLVLLIAIGVITLILWAFAYLRADRRRMRAVLAERELLAAEMHDTLAQSFAGVGFHLQSIRKGLQISGSVPENLMRKIDVACSMAVTAHRDASQKIASLWHKRRPDGDLLEELHQSAVSMLNGVHISIELQRIGKPQKLPREIHDAFWAIGEEAIANILRHSQAGDMRVSLLYGGRFVELRIEDDGVGFDCERTPAGAGRNGMGFRASQIDAKLEILSAPGQGCKVVAQAPIRLQARLKTFVEDLQRRALNRA